jgi:hypothetical protein
MFSRIRTPDVSYLKCQSTTQPHQLLIRAVYEGLQEGSHFVLHGIPILKLAHQEDPLLEKEEHHIQNQLCRHVWRVRNDCHFLALFSAIE